MGSSGLDWLQGSVPLYPPRALWKALPAARARAAWKKAVAGALPVDLYLHLPKGMAGGGASPGELFESERRSLGLPRGLPVLTLYAGGGGDGTLSLLTARELEGLYRWVRGAFGLCGLRQSVAEIDYGRITEAKARVLVRAGVDRAAGVIVLTKGGGWARALAGLRLCREGGIAEINVDLSADDSLDIRTARDFLKGLRLAQADSLHVPDRWRTSGLPGVRTLLKGLPRPAPARRRKGNLQLERPGSGGRHLLGLGPGALSSVSGALLYEGTEGLGRWKAGRLSGRAPRLRGAAMTRRGEMRGFIIGRLADSGHLGPGEFKRRFGMPPWEAFPAEFRRLERMGKGAPGARELRARPEDFMEPAVLAGLNRRRNKRPRP